MDFESFFEDMQDEKRLSPLVFRHLNQLKTLGCSKKSSLDGDFGLLRLLQAHESFVYVFYEKLVSRATSGFHGYTFLCESTLTYQQCGIRGKVLVLDWDNAFGSFAENKLAIDSLCGINVFFDSLVYTPMPFLFVPDPELSEIADFCGKIFDSRKSSNTVCGGTIGESCFVVLEPLTLQNIGLGFLYEDIIKDPAVVSFLYGFAYRKESIQH